MDIGFIWTRHPESGRSIGDAIAKEAGRGDADDSEGVSLNENLDPTIAGSAANSVCQAR